MDPGRVSCGTASGGIRVWRRRGYWGWGRRAQVPVAASNLSGVCRETLRRSWLVARASRSWLISFGVDRGRRRPRSRPSEAFPCFSRTVSPHCPGQGWPRRAEALSRASRLAPRAERSASAPRRLGPDPDLVPRGATAPTQRRPGRRCVVTWI